jgi:PAS domain S-box-containing protein
MGDEPINPDLLIAEIEHLRSRLAEPEETLEAIRRGAVDAFVVSEPQGERVYALRRADPPYRLIVEEMAEGAATLDADGTVVYANRRLADMLSFCVEPLRGHSFRALVADDDLPAFDKLLASGAGGRGEVALKRQDGGFLPVQLSVSSFRDSDSSILCLVVTDLSDQKRLAALAAEEAARSEMNRRKDEFLAMLGHELRNPLAAISAATAVLGEPSLPPERTEWARGSIERQVRLLTRMVDELLDVSRIARGRIELSKQDVDLCALVTRLASWWEALAREKGRLLSVSVPEEPLLVHADAARYSQILSNLVDNAFKFTSEGDRISVVLERAGRDARLSVADTGDGIPPANLRSIFELFTQVGRPGVHANAGLGIGLAVVRTLTELHGGTVRAASEGPGRGSEFTVTIPLRISGTSGAHEAAPAPPRRRGVPRRILVVEDHADSAEGIKLLLELAGHEILVAADGAGALSCCADFRPDAVLLDIGLPDMDGYEVGRELRARLGAAVLIVALTGFGAEEDRRRSAEAGIDHHLLKPVSVELIEELLESVTGTR